MPLLPGSQLTALLWVSRTSQLPPASGHFCSQCQQKQATVSSEHLPLFQIKEALPGTPNYSKALIQLDRPCSYLSLPLYPGQLVMYLLLFTVVCLYQARCLEPGWYKYW